MITGRAISIGGYQYYDAQTDDARLVLRVIREAVRSGGTAHQLRVRRKGCCAIGRARCAACSCAIKSPGRRKK